MAGGCEDYWRETGVAGVPVRYCRCGTGSPVVILHHDIGCPDRADFAQALSGAHDVLMPVHPGFGLGSERAEWMRSVRDLAVPDRGPPARPRPANAPPPPPPRSFPANSPRNTRPSGYPPSLSGKPQPRRFAASTETAD
ncbi:MAG: hypothetical protein OXE57_01555, partial [Alphaproteobacteria bacterium]|nr:hypothetical protein [Alphaproteobacteria bacterium]